MEQIGGSRKGKHLTRAERVVIETMSRGGIAMKAEPAEPDSHSHDGLNYTLADNGEDKPIPRALPYDAVTGQILRLADGLLLRVGECLYAAPPAHCIPATTAWWGWKPCSPSSASLSRT